MRNEEYIKRRIGSVKREESFYGKKILYFKNEK